MGDNNIIKLVPPEQQRGAEDARYVANHLRQIADLIESGDVTDLVMPYCHNGEFLFTDFTSMERGLLMSALTKAYYVDKIRGLVE